MGANIYIYRTKKKKKKSPASINVIFQVLKFYLYLWSSLPPTSCTTARDLLSPAREASKRLRTPITMLRFSWTGTSMGVCVWWGRYLWCGEMGELWERFWMALGLKAPVIRLLCSTPPPQYHIMTSKSIYLPSRSRLSELSAVLVTWLAPGESRSEFSVLCSLSRPSRPPFSREF